MCMVDGLLTGSNIFVILVGSYSFFKCIKQRGKTMAKMASQLRKQNKKKKKEKGEQQAEETKGEPTTTNKKSNRHAKVHPIMI